MPFTLDIDEDRHTIQNVKVLNNFFYLFLRES